MNCVEWEERLSLYAGGDLAGEDRAAVERHLGECAGCQVFLSGLTEVMQVVKEAHAVPPAEAHFAAVRARVMTKLERRRRWVWVWGAAAALAAGLLIAALVHPGPNPTPVVRPPEVAVVQPPPAVVGNVTARPRASHKRRPETRWQAKLPAAPEPPLVVKLVTDDPDVVIYWITDTRGDLK